MKIILFVLFLIVNLYATPVGDYGQLSVSGTKIVNSNNSAIQLRGMSLFWNNYDNVTFWEPWIIKKMAINYNMNIIRLAVGASDADGTYFYDADSDIPEVEKMVDAAIEAGIYVIIDWHGHKANEHVSDAKSFFSYMAQKYGDKPNVIFEIWNEPTNVSWATIKSYAESVIPEIRKYSDNIIVVGTPTWSQDVDVASYNKITGYNNIAYTLHFYAASHKDDIRSKANTALNNGIALFVTEWGTCEYDGNGTFDQSSSDTWVSWMNSNKISWCNWALFNKNETSSALLPTADNSGDWSSSDLSTSGNYVFGLIKNSNPKYIDDSQLSVTSAKSSGNYIYLIFSKPVATVSNSDISISGYTVNSVEMKGSLNDEVLITVDKPIKEIVNLDISVNDVYGYSSLNKSIEVTQHSVDLPLKVNVAADKSTDVSAFGFVKEEKYETGKSAWGTIWYDTYGGLDKTSLYSEFYDGVSDLDPVTGTYMYGFKGISVAVPDGDYKVYVLAIEDRTIGPSDALFGYHSFNAICEGDTVAKHFDAYKESGDQKYKVAPLIFTHSVSDGILNVELEGLSDYPMACGIIVSGTDYYWEYGNESVLKSDNIKKNFDVEIYPNPFNPIMNLNVSGIVNGNLSVKVYDVSGKVIKSMNLNSYNSKKVLSIDMSKFASGIYAVKINNNNNKVLLRKAILLK